jgi:hypothetical protein
MLALLPPDRQSGLPIYPMQTFVVHVFSTSLQQDMQPSISEARRNTQRAGNRRIRIAIKALATDDRQLEAIWFGDGYSVKGRAFATAEKCSGDWRG